MTCQRGLSKYTTTLVHPTKGKHGLDRVHRKAGKRGRVVVGVVGLILYINEGGRVGRGRRVAG